MKGKPSILYTVFAAASGLSAAMLLIPASMAGAGTSGFVINSPATLVAGSSNKQVAVMGTVACPSGSIVTIGVQILQPGPKAAHALGDTKGVPVFCSGGTAVPWSVTAISNLPMKPGPASFLAGAWACRPSTSKPTGPCNFTHHSGDVTLQ